MARRQPLAATPMLAHNGASRAAHPEPAHFDAATRRVANVRCCSGSRRLLSAMLLQAVICWQSALKTGSGGINQGDLEGICRRFKEESIKRKVWTMIA